MTPILLLLLVLLLLLGFPVAADVRRL